MIVTVELPSVLPVVVDPPESITNPPAFAIETTVPALSEGSGFALGKLWSSAMATKPPRELRRLTTWLLIAVEVGISFVLLLLKLVVTVFPCSWFKSVVDEVKPSTLLISAAVAVTASKIFNSFVEAVTPSKMFNSPAVEVTPVRIFNSAVELLTPSSLFNSPVLNVAPSRICTYV